MLDFVVQGSTAGAVDGSGPWGFSPSFSYGLV